jgi:hypothetical protein
MRRIYMPEPTPSPATPPSPPDLVQRIFDGVIILACLGTAVWVVLNPEIGYAKTSQATLFVLLSLLPAVLLTRFLHAEFRLNLRAASIRAGGLAGFLFAALMLLSYLTRPEFRIATYNVRDPSGEPAILDGSGVVKVNGSHGEKLDFCVADDRVYIVFPEQVPQATLEVRHPPVSGQMHAIPISYAGNRPGILTLSKEGGTQ